MKCQQKVFENAHSLGCRTTLDFLEPKSNYQNIYFFKLQAKLLILNQNYVMLSSIIFARSRTLNKKILMSGQQFGRKLQKVILRNCRKIQKSITNGVLQPELKIESQYICFFFFLYLTEEKHFFIKKYILRFQFFHNFVTCKKQISTFLHKIVYFFGKKCQTTHKHFSIYQGFDTLFGCRKGFATLCNDHNS